MNDPLQERIERSGAVYGTMIHRRGPLHFGEPGLEYAAVRQGSGLLAIPWESVIRFTGKDRVSFLQGMTTNNVETLATGSVQLTTVCDITGHLCGVLQLCNAGDAIWAVMDSGCAKGVVEQLDHHLVMEEVEIAELNAAWGVISLQGPRSTEWLSRLGGQPVAPREGQLIQWSFGGRPALLFNHDRTGSGGMDFVAPVDTLPGLWTALMEAASKPPDTSPLSPSAESAGSIGQSTEDSEGSSGFRPVGLEALNSLRVEAGIPWWGEDLDRSVLMLEASLDQAIDYNKGCYLGQETIARVHFRGHTNRQLTGLLLPDGSLAPSGSVLRSEDREAGRITSPTHSFEAAQNIALGFVRREFLAPGTTLSMEDGRTAEVIPLPFYKRRLVP